MKGLLVLLFLFVTLVVAVFKFEWAILCIIGGVGIFFPPKICILVEILWPTIHEVDFLDLALDFL